MIHKIALENYFSIAERQELVFKVPDNAPELPCFRASRALPETRLPVVVGFFGPNASGKSTILRALVATINFAANSFSFGVDGGIPLFHSYMRRDWLERQSVIIVEFDGQLNLEHPSTLFRYELRIAYERDVTGYAIAKTVAYELLSHAPKGRFKKIFERKGQNFSFGEEFGITDNDPRIQSIRPNASIVSTLAQLNHAISINFKTSLAGIQTNIHGFDKIHLHPNQLLPFYFQNPNYLERLNRELRRLDVGLEEMAIEQGPGGLFAKFKHSGLDLPILIDIESSGTRQFIDIFARIYHVLQTGAVALIDELDTALHPLLVPEIFRWLGDLSHNPNGAQLFFTSHNPALLDEMEKEQIFFTDKSSSNSTKIYGAKDIKGLRREPSLMKKYLSGELGAVPHIG